jgi:c-di-GMP-related signal transduction protein
LSPPRQANSRDLAGSLRKLPIKLLAQGVTSREQMEHCRNLGFALFQGRYFAQAEIVSGRRLSASQAALIRLVNLVGRDVETGADRGCLQARAGADAQPAAGRQLGRMHRGSRLAQPVTSLRHAITLFGRRQLQRWLSLLLLAPARPTRPTRPAHRCCRSPPCAAG